MDKFAIHIGGSILRYGNDTNALVNDDGRLKQSVYVLNKNYPLTFVFDGFDTVPIFRRDTLDVTDLSFSTQKIGGFASASATVEDYEINVGRYLSMLGGDVWITRSSGEIVWEGFVNKVSYTGGRMNTEVGPVLDIANRIQIAYTGVKYGVPGEDQSSDKRTDWIEDQVSQFEWGLMELILSGGEITPDEAERALSIALLQYPYLQRKIDLSPANEETTRRTVSVQIECSGYYSLLEKRYVGLTQLELQGIQDILSGGAAVGEYLDIAEIIREYFFPYKIVKPWGIETTGLTRFEYYEQKTARQAAEDFVGLLSTTDQNWATDIGFGWLFGVFHDRTAVLRPIERPANPTCLADTARGIIVDGVTGTEEVHVYPGDWLGIRESVTQGQHILSPNDMYAIESTEYYLDGRVTINEQKYDFLERLLKGRGV